MIEVITLNNGRIVLIHGDCLEYFYKIKRQVNLIIADPPYYKIVNDDWDNAWPNELAYIEWCALWFRECYNKLHDTGSFYLWQGIGKKQQVLLQLCIELSKSFTFQDWITWRKSRGLGNRKGWLFTREECLWYSKTKDYIWNELAQYDLTQPTNRSDMGFNGKPRKSQYKRYTNVWDCNEDQNYGTNRIRGHYTPKPLILIERIVNAHTLTSSDLVIDPFMGSGTTGVACVKLNRCFIGIEKDRTSFEYALTRITQEVNNVNGN